MCDRALALKWWRSMDEILVQPCDGYRITRKAKALIDAGCDLDIDLYMSGHIPCCMVSRRSDL